MGSREESLGRESEDLHLNDEGASDKDRGVVGKIAVHARSVVPDSVTLWTVTRQAPLSVGFSRWEYWSGLPCPPSGNLPKPGIEPRSPALQVNSLLTEPSGKPRKIAGQLQIELKRGIGVIDIDLELIPPAKTWEWWAEPWRWNLGEIATSKWEEHRKNSKRWSERWEENEERYFLKFLLYNLDPCCLLCEIFDSTGKG